MQQLKFLIFAVFIGNIYGQECNGMGQCENAQLTHLLTTQSALECLQSCVQFSDGKWYTFRSDNTVLNCECFETCGSIVDDCDDHSCTSGQDTCLNSKCDQKGICLGKQVLFVLDWEAC